MKNLKYAIEGILFAAGEPVKAARLAVVLEEELDRIRGAVEELKEEYNRDNRGFTIIDIDEGYQICSRPEYYVYIQDILGEQRRQALSNAAMEALAIIAYKQPVTRSGVEFIRGVNSDGAVNRLVERGLIEEKGRLDAPGRPILYGTTQNFLRCFGLPALDKLPPVVIEEAGAIDLPEEADAAGQTDGAAVPLEENESADDVPPKEAAGEVGETEQEKETTGEEE